MWKMRRELSCSKIFNVKINVKLRKKTLERMAMRSLRFPNSLNIS